MYCDVSFTLAYVYSCHTSYLIREASLTQYNILVSQQKVRPEWNPLKWVCYFNVLFSKCIDLFCCYSTQLHQRSHDCLILMKNEEQAFVGNSKDNDSSGMYISVVLDYRLHFINFKCWSFFNRIPWWIPIQLCRIWRTSQLNPLALMN